MAMKDRRAGSHVKLRKSIVSVHFRYRSLKYSVLPIHDNEDCP